MKNTKDFQERFERWKNGESYWDIRGVDLPKYDDANKDTQYIFKTNDDRYYASPTNSSAFTEYVTPVIRRSLSNEATWDYRGDSGKIYKTNYTDDDLRDMAMQSLPYGEFYSWTDLNGLKYRDPRVIGMSGADPMGVFAVETVLGDAAYKTMLEKPLKAVGESLTDLVARDFRFTKAGNWLANRIKANDLNKQIDQFTGNVIKIPILLKPMNSFQTNLNIANDIVNRFNSIKQGLKNSMFFKNNSNFTLSPNNIFNPTANGTINIKPKGDIYNYYQYMRRLIGDKYKGYPSSIVDQEGRFNGLMKSIMYRDPELFGEGILGDHTYNYGLSRINLQKLLNNPDKLNETIVHEAVSHGTDPIVENIPLKRFLPEDIVKQYGIGDDLNVNHYYLSIVDYLNRVLPFSTKGSKNWEELRSTLNQVRFKHMVKQPNTFKELLNESSLNIKDPRVENIMDDIFNSNAYGEDYFNSYFMANPEEKRAIFDYIKNALKYLPSVSIPVINKKNK